MSGCSPVAGSACCSSAQRSARAGCSIVGQSVPTSSTVPVSAGGRDSISIAAVENTLQSKRPPETTSPQYSQRSPPPGPNGAPQFGQWKLRTAAGTAARWSRSEEHTSELQSHLNLVCRLLLEKKKQQTHYRDY